MDCRRDVFVFDFMRNIITNQDSQSFTKAVATYFNLTVEVFDIAYLAVKVNKVAHHKHINQNLVYISNLIKEHISRRNIDRYLLPVSVIGKGGKKYI